MHAVSKARRRLFPETGSEWMTLAGTTVVFDGEEAPTTQTFGLGMFEEVTEAALGEMEEFFKNRGTATMHEVCPHAGVAAMEMLCGRGYVPMEVSNVLYRAVEVPGGKLGEGIRVRTVGADEAELWGSISARGWTHQHKELEEFMKQMGALCVAREQSPCFLAEVDGVPGAAGGTGVARRGGAVCRGGDGAGVAEAGIAGSAAGGADAVCGGGWVRFGDDGGGGGE